MSDMKKAFAETWALSEKKEAKVIQLLESLGVQNVRQTGFGAGSTKYIKGSGEDNGYARSAPDITFGNAGKIEVTGPLKPMSESADIWITRAKVAYAESHREQQYWLAHLNGLEGVMRFVPIGPMFSLYVKQGRIKPKDVTNRGIRERFYALPASSPLVFSQAAFEQFITKYHVNHE